MRRILVTQHGRILFKKMGTTQYRLHGLAETFLSSIAYWTLFDDVNYPISVLHQQ